MTQLLGPSGQPIKSMKYAGRPPLDKPVLGETNVQWGGDHFSFMSFPDGGRLVLDPSRLTLRDYRIMKSHYQINSSLTVLTFMMHQLDWRIEGSNARVQKGITYAMEKVWTRLVRAMGTSFWSGYSPCAIQWENDPSANMVVINKIKDLVPEHSEVKWKEIEAGDLNRDSPIQTVVKPKSRVFDGITQNLGGSFSSTTNHIPVANSFWYPLLMENGDMGGTKLLKSAYAPWFFSNMMHAYANSYYERFGEPLPIARAPYDESITLPDKSEMRASDFMKEALTMLRSGAAVVLPNDRQSSYGSADDKQNKYEYEIEYLESQMRGADFEKHLSRLDEEMSLALFTPLLLMRTQDGGGYNQAVSQTQIYLWQVNALAADWQEYIDKYIIAPLVRYNYGGKQWAKIKFRKMGVTQQETVRMILQELVRSGKASVDLQELGFAAGLTVEEVEQVVGDGQDDSATPAGDVGDDGAGGDGKDKRIGRPERSGGGREQPGVDNPKTTTKGM